MQNQFKWESHGSGLMTGLLQEARTQKHVFHSVSISYLKKKKKDKWLFLRSLQVLLGLVVVSIGKNHSKGKCACAVIKWGVTKILLWAKTTTSFQNSWFSASQPFSSPRDRKRILCPRLQAHLSTFIVVIFTQSFIFLVFLANSLIDCEGIWQMGLEKRKQLCEWMEDEFKMLGEGGLINRRDSL